MGIDVGGECCFLAMAVVRLAAQKDQGGGEDAAPMGRIVGGWSLPIPNEVWASASLGARGPEASDVALFFFFWLSSVKIPPKFWREQ